MPGSIACSSPTTSTAWRRCPDDRPGSGARRWARGLFAPHDPVDEKARPEARAEAPLQGFGIVLSLDPGQEGNAPGLALAAVEIEKLVEDARLREAEMAVSHGELALGLVDGPALEDHEIEGGHEARPVRARLAVQDGRVLDLVEEVLRRQQGFPVGRPAGADDELLQMDAEALA